MLRPTEYRINIGTPETEIPTLTKECFNKLKDRYGCNLKITDLPEYLRTISSQKFDGIDYKSDWTPMFESYLIDLQKNFMSGCDIDMVVFHQDIIKIFHLTKLERQLLVDENFEERLWAIWLAVSCPTHSKFIINND